MSCSEGPGDFHFELPRELIAQEAPARREDARLLVVETGGRIRGLRRITDLAELLDPGDLLVGNDSRVLPARLRARRQSGGRVEFLLIRPLDTGAALAALGAPADGAGRARATVDAAEPWLAMARPARRLRAGEILSVEAPPGTAPDEADEEMPRVEVFAPPRDGRIVLRGLDRSLPELAEERGETPLPPYIERRPDDPATSRRRPVDRERYQTVYARTAGSVAAPTAGLHFSADGLAALERRGIAVATLTLHVGPGTFQPPSPEQVLKRRLHREFFRLPAEVEGAVRRTRAAGGRVVAVGTTTLRVLETIRRQELPEPTTAAAARLELGAGEGDPVCRGEARRRDAGWEVRGSTRLFLQPGDPVAGADGLLTNFHLPGSSLLMLVSALLGSPAWREVYQRAVAERLRFYSYGDAMLILPARAPGEPDAPEREGDDS